MSDYQSDPLFCSECDEKIVVTRPEDWDSLDEQVTFECGCDGKVGHISCRKPDSWGVQFL